MFVLSFSTVFADDGGQAEGAAGDGTQTVVTTDDGGDTSATDPPAAEEPAADEPAPAPKPKRVARIIKKGKYYYYRNRNGVIRRKAGFVTVDDKLYCIRKAAGSGRTAPSK